MTFHDSALSGEHQTSFDVEAFAEVGVNPSQQRVHRACDDWAGSAPARARELHQTPDVRERELHPELPRDQLAEDLQAPGRSFVAVLAGTKSEECMHPNHDILVDLARPVVGPVVQQTRFSFPFVSLYSAVGGRGDTSHLARRAVAVETARHLLNHADADPDVGVRTPTVELLQPPTGGTAQLDPRLHLRTSLSRGFTTDTPVLQVRSRSFNAYLRTANSESWKIT